MPARLMRDRPGDSRATIPTAEHAAAVSHGALQDSSDTLEAVPGIQAHAVGSQHQPIVQSGQPWHGT